MDDLDVLARDFGFRPQGKAAPMRSDASDRRSASARSSSTVIDDRDSFLFNDVYGGPPKYSSTSATTTATSNKSSPVNDFDYDSIFKSSASSNNVVNNSKSEGNSSKTTSFPVYDKPVYDDVYEDDIFEGLPGVKSKSVSSSMPTMGVEENIFASMASPVKQNRSDRSDQFDDLLGNFGRHEKVPEPKSSDRSSSAQAGFDDLLGGFSTATSVNRSSPAPSKSNQTTSSVIDDPFVVLESTSTPASSSSGVFTDPLDEISKLGKSETAKADASSVSGGVFDDLDPLNGFGKSMPPFSPEKGSREKDMSPSRSGASISGAQASTGREHGEKSSFRYSGSHSQKVPLDNFQESPLFDMPSVSTDSKSFIGQNASSPPSYASATFNEKNFQADLSPRSEDQAKSTDDIWLTVSEIPLFTQPTKAPPPSRPPPPIPRQTSKTDSGFFSTNARRMGGEYPPSYSSHSETPKAGRAEGKSPPASQIDELDDFAMGRTPNSFDESASVNSSEEMDAAAAAMKQAMDRAEAKFRHAKEVREREHAKAARSKETVHVEEDEQVMQDTSEREFRENQESLERERRQREKEEEEREQRRLERVRQAEIERLRARQAVERATREARERLAVGARDKAAAEARQRFEKAAADKAQAEARDRAGRVAVQRAQAEARERAAAEARERAEKAAAETRERANAEAREKEAKERAEARRRADRASVDRANAEARERAASDARERAAAAASAKTSQQKNDNDLESFFSSRPSSAPKARSSPFNPFSDSQAQNKERPDAANRTSYTSVPPSNIKKASSTTNIVDDLSSIFGAPSSSGEFQDVEGETEERRRARLERHQRTQERAAKALAEKNQRDLQAQRDQEERHKYAETLDSEIKRWAAGKEGNLRALLSTLQYVLWPECGWQPVSLTDLITGANVKKVYRKATLCIHPDKVQQKGATLQQKYIAEKVFDLLKEAWNKLNSEELF